MCFRNDSEVKIDDAGEKDINSGRHPYVRKRQWCPVQKRRNFLHRNMESSFIGWKTVFGRHRRYYFVSLVSVK